MPRFRIHAVLCWTITFVALACERPAPAPLPVDAPVPAEQAPFVPPAASTIPTGPEGDAVRLGQLLVTDTRRRLPDNVGSGLNCSNCHIGGGTVALAGPYVGLWGVFPQYSVRSARLITLQDRINDCFERSMNGKALPVESAEMYAILMYIRWLSTGVPTGTAVAGRGMGRVDTSLSPDRANGEILYAQKCSTCHGVNGAGTRSPDGGYTFPPLWGDASYNIGAGMARTYTAASFIMHNMPQTAPNTLSEQEAIDIADYVTHQPRPEYARAKHDYPAGGKPKDARN